jgi:hypothetical protein
MSLVIIGAGHGVGLFFTIIFKKLHSAFCNNIMMSEKKINELNKQQVFYNERKLFLSKVFCNYK